MELKERGRKAGRLEVVVSGQLLDEALAGD
jgi:hypothetical protein